MGLLTDFFTPVAQTFVGASILKAGTSNYRQAPRGYAPGGGFNMAAMDIPGGGIPGYDFIEEPTMQNCGPKPVYKYSCGGYRWVYPKRRRRKQLLTNSDAAGLAKLKGLVGVGKTMDAWIATHS